MSIPAIVAVIQVTMVPPRTAFMPSRAMSPRWFSASGLMSPICIAMKVKLAKPHSAYVDIRIAFSDIT